MNEPSKVLLELNKLKSDVEKLAGSGGGGYTGDMEGRIGKIEGTLDGVEKRLTLVEKDIREISAKLDRNLLWKIGLFVSLALSMFVALQSVNNSITSKMDTIGNSISAKVDGVSQKSSALEVGMEKISGRLDVTNQRIDDFRGPGKSH